jgi:hypothetical protein
MIFIHLTRICVCSWLHTGLIIHFRESELNCTVGLRIIISDCYRHIFHSNFDFSVSVSDRSNKYENGNDLGVFDCF